MKFRTHAAAMIYIGSYLPLSMILLTQDYQYEALSLPWCSDWLAFTSQCHIPLRNPLMALSLFAVCLMCFLFTLLTLTCVKPRLEVAAFFKVVVASTVFFMPRLSAAIVPDPD